MHYDGRETDLPVIDNVTTLSFEYFGEPQPPQLIVAVGPDGEAKRSTTYGPMPPPPGRDDPSDDWGPGENCIFAIVDGEYLARLPKIAATAAPILLTPELLTNGPWCPDAVHEERFDADLLRVRRIRVKMRVQATRSFRGPAGVLFAYAGSATAAARYVPDRAVQFDVAPRELNLER
jgi:hypothetical protein